MNVGNAVYMLFYHTGLKLGLCHDVKNVRFKVSECRVLIKLFRLKSKETTES
jgi:hypothetical protein